MAMICKRCGHKLEKGAKFCPNCGEMVLDDDFGSGAEDAAFDREFRANQNSTQEDTYGSSSAEYGQESSTQYDNFSGETAGNYGAYVNEDEKINWRALLTAENIERFAPAAALFPFGMWITSTLVSTLMFMLAGFLPIGALVSRVITTVIKAAFIATTGAAAGGLVYVAVNKKDTSKPETWVAPAATILAFVSCMGTAFGWGAVSSLLGLVAVVIGIELLARVVIAGEPMDSKVNFGAAFGMYKKYYDDYKAKHPTTKDLERQNVVLESRFDGSGIELFGYVVLSALVGIITCGIATPWMICKVYRWRISHTVINGKRLTFTGNGGSLLGHWILWEILTIVTCGIYGFCVHVALRKWELERTYIEGEPIVAGKKESYFDGSSIAYLGYGILSAFILILTLGLAYPWVMALLQGWDTKHQVINGHRLSFSGTGLGFLGEYLIIFVLTVITCGIYGPWGTVRINKYIFSHTHFVD